MKITIQIEKIINVNDKDPSKCGECDYIARTIFDNSSDEWFICELFGANKKSGKTNYRHPQCLEAIVVNGDKK